jgi:hypothetical protein
MTVVKDTKLENAADRLRREVRSMAARQDIEGLAQLPPDQLQLRRHEASERVETRSNRALDEGRNPSDREESLSKADLAEIEALDAALVLAERSAANEERSVQLRNAVADAVSGPPVPRNEHTPLLVSELHMRSHADAIRRGTTFGAVEEVETRAKVTVASHYGSAGAWDSASIAGPVTLRAFAGIPNSQLTGATAQMPSITLPAGAAGVVETANHGEFDAAAVANLTALRYGRWTDVTSFVDEFDDLNAINQAHAVGIARDLNLADGNAIETAAGGVVAFSGTLLEQNIREAILKVAAAVLVDPTQVVIFGRSASLAPIVGYAPTSGDDRGTVSARVYGARVYTAEQATAKNVYAFAPRAFRTFSTRLASASIISPESGNHRFGQWTHSTPAGVGVVGGAAGVATIA